MTRTRTNLAWFLRGIAKWFNVRAEALDPIKLNRPTLATTSSRAYMTSKSQAEQIIERARAH